MRHLNNLIVSENVKVGPLIFLDIRSVAKYQRNIEGGPFESNKKFLEKISQSRKKVNFRVPKKMNGHKFILLFELRWVIVILYPILEVTDRSAILYVGDHIFGDILKCKKDADWKTLLIVEELDKQITKWEQSQDAINDLKKIEAEKKRLELETVMSLEKNPSSGSFYESKTLNSCGTLELSSMTIRDVSFENLEQQALAKTKEVDSIHGKMGGIFKSGMKETLYSFQVRLEISFI